eukprot:gene28755-12115_t
MAKEEETLLVSPCELQDVRLYKKVDMPMRLDVAPFGLLWALYMGIVFSYAPESEGTELWWLGAGLIAVLQGLATISSQWSVGLKCAIGCKE